MNKKNELSELNKFFYKAIQDNASGFFNILNRISNIKNQSFYNSWLLLQQNPNISNIFTKEEWEKYGHKIKDDARPYIVLRPFGPVDFVYDVEDTEREILFDAEFTYKGFIENETLNNLIKSTTRNNIYLNFEQMAIDHKGSAFLNENNHYSINLNSNNTDEESFLVLSHELSHILLGHFGGIYDKSMIKNKKSLPENIKEIEAHSVSLLIALRFNISSNYEIILNKYLDNSSESLKRINLDDIFTVANKIQKMSEKVFKLKEP
jgi:Zn-dependent peptidase ImmA (M78 family)